jgi:hypothetical protein
MNILNPEGWLWPMTHEDHRIMQRSRADWTETARLRTLHSELRDALIFRNLTKRNLAKAGEGQR